MTIRLRRSTAAILIGLVGLLGGMALGQVTQATSQPTASTSAAPRFERTLKSIDRKLGKIQTVLGSSFGYNNVLDEVEKVTANTYGTCKAVDAFGCRP
jgi:hypothetical protein